MVNMGSSPIRMHSKASCNVLLGASRLRRYGYGQVLVSVADYCDSGKTITAKNEQKSAKVLQFPSRVVSRKAITKIPATKERKLALAA